VTCAYGEILDVLIDLRIDSPTYLKVEKVPLKADAGDVLFIPSGVGHSFLVVSDSAAVTYLTSSEFDPDSEKTVSPLDKALGIDWPTLDGVEFSLSDRDKSAPTLAEAKVLGHLPHFRG
jgi:dTDP-4-dehydrorhamnose 3,5-epimerase